MLSKFKKLAFFKILVLSSIFVSGNFITNNAYGIECVGPDGCPKQIKKIHRFARNGSVDAQLLLAALYEDGNLIVRNDKKAFRWYRKATKNVKGISVAFYKVGVAYLYGKGTSINISKGIKHLTKAAEHHHVNSQLLLGFLNFKGEIVKKDLTKARYWFKRAAESKDARAAFALAQMSEFGLGGKKNMAEAKKWYIISAQKGYKNASQKIAQLQPKLASSENPKTMQVADNSDSGIDKGTIFTTYGNKMDEIQMMDIVLENIIESNQFNGPRTGSSIPGHGCGDERRNCVFLTDRDFINRFLGLY